MPNVIEDRWDRFVGHWAASTIGYFLRQFLPVMKASIDSAQPGNGTGAFWSVFDPRAHKLSPAYWWEVLLFAALLSLVSGAINSNLPCKPREMLKSLGLGFALDAAKLLNPH